MNRICGVFLMILVFLSGCASEGLSKIKDGALGLVGASSVNEKKLQPVSRQVELKLFAGRSLNADDRGRGMAVVVRFYRLKDPAAFMQASYEVLADPAREKAALAADLVDVKEVAVKPGEELSRVETLSAEAPYVGVVALFRTPAPDRWRLVFAGEDKGNAKGIVLGAHACALTVSQGVPYNAQLVNPGSLGGVTCR
ncbi:type VI secretion system lipoprotein TssJ [Uliginosibacterium paludis]|uniref:Type VI secretion system lipoprotein TssJ n=1 Tax=Uliginosibacterium paludis TaxID=1615952 RepID=A0ABV2CPX0_9RHOO